MEDITEIIEDCPHSTAKNEGQGFALIRTPNIGIGHLIFDNVHRVSKKVYDIRNARAVPKTNDIIYAREAPAGNAAIISDREKVCLGQRTVLIRPMQKLVDSMWLTYSINSPYARKALISKATGSTVTHVNMENIRSLALPLPPLQEQKRLVESIEHWLALVDEIEENKDKLQETINQAKSKILDLAIHGKLVPQDPTDEPAAELLKRINPKAEITCDNRQYGKLPNGWCLCKLKDICSFESGYAFSSDNYKCIGTPLVRISNITNIGTIDITSCVYIQEDVEDKFKINTGDLLIAMSGATTGKMGIYKSYKTAYLNQRVGNLKCSDALYSLYRNYFMFSKTNYILKIAYGGAQPNISAKAILNMEVLLPPLNEQHRIVAKIEELFAQLDTIEASL